MPSEHYSTNSQRLVFIDLLKCFGMYIVVSGHIHPKYGWFSLPLHSFVIPMFFFLSGLTYKANKHSSILGFIKHRCKTLLLPYALLSFASWLFWVGYNLVSNGCVFSTTLLYPLFQTLIAQGSGGFLIHNVPLWFVPCLFCIETIYYLIDKLNSKLTVILSLVFASIGVFMITGPFSFFFKLLPWSLESAFAALIFYSAGNIITKKITLQQIQTTADKHKWKLLMVMFILTPILVVSSYYNGHISLGSDLLGKSPLLFYTNAFIGIIVISFFSLWLASYSIKSNSWQIIRRFQLWFGRNSFFIMATHVPIKGMIMVILAKAIHKTVKWISLDIMSCAFVFITTCILSSLAAIIINKMKVHDEKMWKRIRNPQNS